MTIEINEHNEPKLSIRRQDITSVVARHFNELGHNFKKKLLFTGIEEVL